MRIVLKLDDVWAFDDKSLAIQTTVFSTWFMTFMTIPYTLVIICQIKLEFVTYGYFKVPFQDPGPTVKYSENSIFVTSHFGTLYK